MKKSRRNGLYRQLVVATLLMGGAFNLAAPVLAAGTAAGKDIINRATATYDDDNDANNGYFNATSNTVTIKVAEVAGITVTSQAVTDTTPNNAVITGDIVRYDFLVTNTGNDTTKFYIPDQANITVNGGTIVNDTTNPGVQYSTDGGTTWQARPAADGLTGAIPANGSILVRVPVKVTANAANANISVVFGDTGTPEDNKVTDGTQNQPDDGQEGAGGGTDPVAGQPGSEKEVRTYDDTGAGDTAGAPVNGEREASAKGSILLGAQPQAFAVVTKTHSDYKPNNASLNDHRLSYNLGLEVKGTAPAGSTGLVAANLVGTSINIDGALTNKILVSDAIPDKTVLTNVTNPLPTGWTVVYVDDPTALSKSANDPTVVWKTGSLPSNLSTVKRIGFIHDGEIAAGTSVTGLKFEVKTIGVTGTTKIASIAQVFGRTKGDEGDEKATPPVPPTVVYDESGDANPNNFNDNGTAPATNNPTNGVANPANDGEDTANNNTATNSPGGEDNVFIISAPGSVLNGPLNKPDAINNDTNDDFTNKSSPVPEKTDPGTKINPEIVEFKNTISNPSSTTINNLLLVPTPPTTPGEVLPSGTIVKLKVGNQSATYKYDGTKFSYDPAQGDTAIKIDNLTPGAKFDYTVQVDLPTDTALSTDTGKGYPVPIVAFVDTNSNGMFDSNVDTTTYNISIDRVYTGFLKLEKKARIQKADGTFTDYFSEPTPEQAKEFRPGRILEYQITYTNISSPQATGTGSNNVVLNATRVSILEDGAKDLNTWAKDNDDSGTIDTAHVAGKATDSNGGVIEYSNTTGSLGTTDPGANATVTQYKDSLPNPVQPQKSGTFTFQRKLDG